MERVVRELGESKAARRSVRWGGAVQGAYVVPREYREFASSPSRIEMILLVLVDCCVLDEFRCVLGLICTA